jgi:hypothetical protein
MAFAGAAAGVFLIAALARIGLRYVGNPRTFSSRFPLDGDQGDAMVHLLMIEEIRRNGRRIPRADERFLVGRNFDYPALYHWLLAFVPRDRLERFEWMLSPLIEGVHAVLVLAALWWIAAPEQGVAASAVVLAAIGYTLTPLLFTFPWQACVLTPRVFGMLFGHAYLFFATMVVADGALLWVVAAAVAFTIVACSSKFSLQACVLISLAMAIVALDWRPLAVLAISTGAAIALSGGYAWWVAGGLVNHSRSYFLMQSWTVNTTFSTRDLFAGLLLIATGHPLRGWRRIKEHPVHRIVNELPWLWLLLAVVAYGALTGAATEQAPANLIAAMWAWALGAILVTAVITAEPLRFLGEGYRYLEYAILPFLALILLDGGRLAQPMLAAGLAWSLWLYFRVLRQFRGALASPGSADNAELRHWFAERAPMTLMAIPGRVAFPLLYGTRHRAVWWLVNAPRNDPEAWQWWLDWMRDSTTRFPFLSYSIIARSAVRFGVDALVLDTRAASMVGDTCEKLQAFPVLFRNRTFLVYDLALLRQAGPDTPIGALHASPASSG